MDKKRICLTCGKTFTYCGHCDGAKYASWKNNYCSENCRDIFKTVMDYIGGYIPIGIAKSRLLEKNLSINISSNIINTYSKIMAYEKSEPKKTENSIKPESQSIKTIVEEQPKPRRRRRKRVEEVDE